MQIDQHKDPTLGHIHNNLYYDHDHCTTDQVHEVNSHSLLLRVEGSEASSRPYMLAAHLDVVPPGDTDRSHVS